MPAPWTSLDPALAGVIGVAVGAILVSGAWSKWREREIFAQAMQGYDLIPDAAVPSASLAFIGAEFAVGLALFAPFLRPLPQLAGLGLLSIVTAAVVINLLRGRTDISCGCGGASGEQSLSWALVARNGALLVLLGIAALPTAPRALAWADYGVMIVGGLLVAGLYAAASQLIANQPRLTALRNGT